MYPRQQAGPAPLRPETSREGQNFFSRAGKVQPFFGCRSQSVAIQTQDQLRCHMLRLPVLIVHLAQPIADINVTAP